jgi:hypothetical protein
MLTWNDRERCATLDHFFEIMVNVDETNRSVQLNRHSLLIGKRVSRAVWQVLFRPSHWLFSRSVSNVS